LCSISSVNFPV
jgi:hypothetical protein